MCMTQFYRSFACHAEHFFKGCGAPGRTDESFIADGKHPLAARLELNLLGCRIFHNKLADGTGHLKHFVNPDPSLVSVWALFGFFGASPFYLSQTRTRGYRLLPVQNIRNALKISPLPQARALGGRQTVCLVLFAEFAYETLGKNRGHGGRDQKRLYFHIKKPRQSACGGIGMQSGEYEVSRERRIDRKRRGLIVAYLAYHDDIGVLAQERAQAVGQCQADFWMCLRLIDARNPILNRILNGGDIDGRRIEDLQNRIERRRLARARGAGRKNDTRRLPDRAMHALKIASQKSELFQRHPFGGFG